jgi:putative nucleotidyltransferase with HDIG domain
MGQLTYTMALEILKRYNLPSERIEHSVGVAEYAFRLALSIQNRHPHLPVDPNKVRIAGLLHDIGRSRPGDHEINSVAILKAEGLPEIASIVMHGTLYEIQLLRGIVDPSLLPQTLENKIVAYADTRFRLAPVSLEERFTDIHQRRSHEAEKLASLDLVITRIRLLEKELLALAGEL